MPNPSRDSQEPGKSLSIRPGSPAWADLCATISKRHGYVICGAKKRDGRPCEARPFTHPDGRSNGKCYYHGGPTPHGMASPQFQHGRLSRYRLTGSLQADYEEGLADLDYISQRDELAVNKALLQAAMDELCAVQLLEPLDPSRFDPEECKKRLAEIDLLRLRQDGVITRIRQLQLDRNRIARTEVARVKLAEDTVTGQQVRLFGQAVLDAVRRRLLEFCIERGASVPEALGLMGEIQGDVVEFIKASRRAPGSANNIHDNGVLTRE